MCSKCNKSVCCCPKVITKIGPAGKPGKNGKDGTSAFIDLISFPASPSYQFDAAYPVPVSGNYAVTFNASLGSDDIAGFEVISRTIKNLTLTASNPNHEYSTTHILPPDTVDSPRMTHTHTAYFVAAAGDSIGFRINITEDIPGVNQSAYRTGTIMILKLI